MRQAARRRPGLRLLHRSGSALAWKPKPAGPEGQLQPVWRVGAMSPSDVRDGFSVKEARPLSWLRLASCCFAMRNAPILGLGLCMILAAGVVHAGPVVEEGPLSPCVHPQEEAGSDSSSAPPASAWGVEIATSFSKQDALDQFARVKRDHADILGAYEPMMVETCDLHMGTAPLYSARIGMESREYGDRLCAKLQADGGACIVQKN